MADAPEIAEAVTVATPLQIAGAICFGAVIGWHIYAINRTEPGVFPTVLIADLPAGVPWASEWSVMERDEHPGDGQYDGSVAFVRSIQTTRPLDIPLNVRFVACTPLLCLPPTSISLIAKEKP